MAQVVRALRPFKVQVKLGEFLHFKMGDRIPHDLLTGPYRDYVMGHCEVATTKVNIPFAQPEKTVEAAANLVKVPPPLKEQWKKVDTPVQPVAADAGHDQWATNGGKEPDPKPAAHAPEKAPTSRATPAKGHPTGKAKPHA